ncbi:uncharacterized protein [Physcomitrium patens]|uniref:WW domain-containing protein n=1 Tax=Physcomitrium patens TaxID=3218 RepID=A0A2K1LAJ0_PHYPA|nr:uncharacterized protein LOC112292081 isoform X2 [Physcomitrium patens]PNR63038.1 hypothetical protein PHYPA_001463 [Physcomitrium patens]|eukprot:XP_024396005.1 uncharacterized protein LOC112292081 isoform X2 [Physcomitrella patens]
MGRAGRVAPRTCSTIELRTHTSSLTISLPAYVSKPGLGCPPSPSTPVQVAPAPARLARLAWPQDAVQVVQLQLEALRSHSMEAIESSTRKRGLVTSNSHETLDASLNKVTSGLEVALKTQPALPEDWEQFLDLKTGQFYYFHWSSCKRTKHDPRELIRRADESVQAHMREAHIRGESSIEHTETASSREDESDEIDMDSGAVSCCPPDVCEKTSGFCSDASEWCADRELGSGDSMWGRTREEELSTSDCGKDTKSPSTVMVVSGCHSCSMFVMLCSSSPACPSCGVRVQSDQGGIR